MGKPKGVFPSGELTVVFKRGLKPCLTRWIPKGFVADWPIVLNGVYKPWFKGILSFINWPIAPKALLVVVGVL